MYESIPSVALSTYVTLMEITNNTNNDNNVSVSVIVSMIFSFISITNIIVSILNKDNTSLSNSPGDEAIAANEIVIVTVNVVAKDNHDDHDFKEQDKEHQDEKEIEIIDTNDDTQAQIDLWVKNEQTGEISFFVEKVKPHSKSSNKKSCPCKSKCTKLMMFIFRFDLKIKNFIIWLFLTSDLFLKTISILSIIVFVNYLFVNNANNNTINFNTSHMSQNEIENCIVSTIINICFLICLLLFEYRLLSFISQKSVKKKCSSKYTIIKYFMIGVFSNFFYFLSAAGLTYLEPLIDSKYFVNNQKFRCFISCSFICLCLLLQFLFDKWIFDWMFCLIFACIVLLNVGCLFYLNQYVFAIG